MIEVTTHTFATQRIRGIAVIAVASLISLTLFENASASETATLAHPGAGETIQNQEIKIKPVPKTVIPTELPVGVIGSYSPIHLGPCYLAKRNPSLLWHFPIVVGQQRDEVVSIPQTVGGKTKFKSVLATLLRRGFGLAPLRPDASKLETPGIAQIQEADFAGNLTSAKFTFSPAKLNYSVSLSKDEKGFPIPSEDWGAGSALATWIPAYVESVGDGLLIEVSISNQSKKTERYFIDLYGGLETIQRAFGAKNPEYAVNSDSKAITFSSAGSTQSFALAASGEGSPVRSYELSEACFSSEGNVTSKDINGNVLPFGMFDSSKPKPERLCGLTRISDINVDPGETRVFHLCVGIGSGSEKALDSARFLLKQSESNSPDRVGKSAILEKASAAHLATKYRSAEPSLERLMAQSLVNTPFSDGSRVGVPNRQYESLSPQGAYEQGQGGWMSLGWIGYRPDWAAAQLVPWFLSKQPPNPVPPIDLFALWELYQRTHNRDTLEKFYPSAVLRYNEFLAISRTDKKSWLCAWLVEGNNTFVPNLTLQRNSPDCSAYLIRSAKILKAAAEILQRPQAEIEGLQLHITQLSDALKTNLWSEEGLRFVSKPTDKTALAAAQSSEPGDGSQELNLKSLTPLICGMGSLTEKQDSALISSIADPQFRTAFGLRSEPRDTKRHLSTNRSTGAISFGSQWIFWKALLDHGEAETARKLAADILGAYAAAQLNSNAYPESLDADTGAPIGRLDTSGQACALFPLYEAYHTPGVATAGWDVCLLDSNYDAKDDTLRVVYRPLENSGSGILLCVMGKPNKNYTANGGVKGIFKSDSTGTLTLRVAKDTSTQQINLTPERTP